MNESTIAFIFARDLGHNDASFEIIQTLWCQTYMSVDRLTEEWGEIVLEELVDLATRFHDVAKAAIAVENCIKRTHTFLLVADGLGCCRDAILLIYNTTEDAWTVDRSVQWAAMVDAY